MLKQDTRPTKLRIVAKQLRTIFPDARITVEDVNSHQWLDVSVSGHTFAVEARRKKDGEGFVAEFSEVTAPIDFGGYDEVYSYTAPQNLTINLGAKIAQVIGRTINIAQTDVKVKVVKNSMRPRQNRSQLKELR